MYWTVTTSMIMSFHALLSTWTIFGLADGAQQQNVYGNALELCSNDPLTGWYRDGYCNTDNRDGGSHVVCAEMTAEFLAYTRARGNDLSTAHPPSFPGLTPGDFWCLCATRWREALDAGVAPRVNVGATHRSALSFRGISRETLEANSATSANLAAASRGGAASGATCDADGGCGTRESPDR